VSTMYKKTDEIGLIVGEATTNSFVFASTVDNCPLKYDYIRVRSKEVLDGHLTEVDILAQVERVFSASDALKHLVSFEALKRIKLAGIDDLKVYGHARVLGFIPNNQKPVVLVPRRSLIPGTEVSIASEQLLSTFYAYPRDEALQIGALITRPEVNVTITATGLRKHLAIIAQTGAGKSYSAGVLIEELLEMGGTVLVIDPHADYVMISMDMNGAKHPLSDRCKVFRNPASTGRYSSKDVGNVQEYTIAFSDLSDDEVFEIAGVHQSYTRIRDAFTKVLSSLRESNLAYTPQDLLNELQKNYDEAEKPSEKSDFQSAMRYARTIQSMSVFGSVSTQTKDILAPMQVSTLDLSGLDQSSMDYIVTKLLRETYSSVTSGEYKHPVFAIIEEAHNFIPAERVTMSSSIIKKIAAEGRKFGVFLIVITQRPSKVHPDTLSQCNSQIIMKMTNPLDQQAVANSSERMSQEILQDLPGLNPGEAVILGPITKTPMMVKIRARRTREGGADIDVVKALSVARKSVSIDRKIQSDRAKTKPFDGSFGGD
jgi:DNA helicase HerA-like ATPase